MRMSGYRQAALDVLVGRPLRHLGANARSLTVPSGRADGQPPLQLAPARCDAGRATAEHGAVAYNDGMILAVRFADAEEALLRRPGGGPVSALAWDDAGRRLAFGTEQGEAGIVSIG
jgi:hypothetical protein